MTNHDSSFSNGHDTSRSSALPPLPGRLEEESVAPYDLEQLVLALRKSRNQNPEHQEELGRPRPSREAVAEIVSDLRAALFPGHFGAIEHDGRSIDFLVGYRLDRALRTLTEQVRRSIAFVAPGSDRSDDWRALAREMVAEFASKLPTIRETLELDVRAAFENDPAAQTRTEILLCYPGVTAVTYHRIAHELFCIGAPLLARIMAELAHSATGIDIHPGAVIGERFFIDHGTGVVIGETCVIGDRVRLYQGVTLGARNFPRGDDGTLVKGIARHPVIGDDVTIFAGATVLGRITIGKGSVIGGNVWVTKSLPDGSVISQARSQRISEFDNGGGI